ncbi:MAG TPA: YggS family pyridoxal phosphate-dependent enzyme [Burkholderiales bacterium]|nr:YggS family pyridoxal phosphate-dependent enzyme [Burkholderiales bacterium]
MNVIVANLQAVRARIAAAAKQAGRQPHDVALIAVSKTFAADAIAQACDAGQTAFGESYLQEALDKMDRLAVRPLEWHFIGPIQSNKTRLIAARFQWVHGIDRARIAERLAAARPAAMPALDVCLQINVSGETTKSGIDPAAAPALARLVAGLPRLRLRGLMAIPRPTVDPLEQRRQFARVRELKEKITASGIALDTLSMGMSDDLEAAIAEGATLVRVGSAIFGQRQKR